MANNKYKKWKEMRRVRDELNSKELHRGKRTSFFFHSRNNEF